MRAVNLLPPDTRGASKVSADLGAGPEAKGGAGPIVVLGVLAACVAGAAGYVLTDNTVKQRQADLVEAQAQQQAIARQAAQLKPYADFDAMARSRVATVKDIAGSRFDWEQVLRDLARAIPDDVTLKALTGDTANGAGGAGGASSQLRGAINAPAITLQGCAPGQTEVSRLLARLHNVQGVTRVTLSKSTKTKIENTGDASGGSTQQRNTMPCGTGKRPDFELVMFFEKAAETVAKAPSATGGTAATPVPSATPTATPESSTTTTAADAAPDGGATP
jgi:Tfp pilus assembly protein PilN